MEKRILNFSEFILENFVFEQEEKKEGVVFIAASTSKTNITDESAKVMGVKKDVIYKVTLKNGLDSIKGLSEKFPLMSFAEKKKNEMTITEGNKVSAGKDILKINDKSIEEKGEINLNKSEVAGKEMVIEASNNGVLMLYRLAGYYGENPPGRKRNDGITGFYKTAGLTLNQTQDYVINIQMGTEDERTSEWIGAWSGSGLQYWMNGVYGLICTATVQQAGGTVKDKLSQEYKTYKQGEKDPKKQAEIINEEFVKMQKELIAKKFLVNSQPIDVKGDLESILSNKSNYKNTVGKITFTDSGISKFVEIGNKVIDHVSKSSRPKGFSERIDSLLPKTSGILKKSLGTTNKESAKKWMDHVQTEHQYSPGKPLGAQQGMQTMDFGEGKY